MMWTKKCYLVANFGDKHSLSTSCVTVMLMCMKVHKLFVLNSWCKKLCVWEELDLYLPYLSQKAMDAGTPKFWHFTFVAGGEHC